MAIASTARLWQRFFSDGFESLASRFLYLINRVAAAKPSNPVQWRYALTPNPVQRRYAPTSNPVQQRYVYRRYALTSNLVQQQYALPSEWKRAARAYPPLAAPAALSRLMNPRSALTHAARSAGVSKSMANPPLSHTA